MVVDFAQKNKRRLPEELLFFSLQETNLHLQNGLQAIICNHIPNLTACN
jgi:hypothetical protein